MKSKPIPKTTPKPIVVRQTKEYLIIELTSSKGQKYEVGYPKSAGYTENSIASELDKHNEEKTSFADTNYKHIHCSPLSSSSVSREAIDIGLVGVFTWKDKDPIFYDYQIMFSNYEGSGFRFKDESGDTYYCSTPRDGNHTINYNSKEPTLIGVKLD